VKGTNFDWRTCFGKAKSSEWPPSNEAEGSIGMQGNDGRTRGAMG
jgi:hypothetical protein